MSKKKKKPIVEEQEIEEKPKKGISIFNSFRDPAVEIE